MSSRAFTLIETIVVVALTTIVMSILGSLLVYMYKTNSYVYGQATATIQARRGIDDATHYLREASYGSDGSYPVQTAATSSITFNVDVNNDQSIDRVSYALQNGVLSRTITSTSVTVTTITSAVVNNASTPLFRYFDKTGVELTAPVDTSKIASVTMTLLVLADARSASTFRLSGSAQLRNSRL